MNFFMPNLRLYLDCPSSGYFHNCYGLYEWRKYVGNGRRKSHGQGTILGPMETNSGEWQKTHRTWSRELILGPNGDRYVGEYKDDMLMVKARILGAMVNGQEINTLVNLRMTRGMAKELIRMPMEIHM